MDTKQTLLVVIRNVIQSDSWADVDKQDGRNTVNLHPNASTGTTIEDIITKSHLRYSSLLEGQSPFCESTPSIDLDAGMQFISVAAQAQLIYPFYV